VTIENVVAKDERRGFGPNEIRTDMISLRQPLGPGLLRIGDRDPPPGTIAQQLLESSLVLGSGNNQDVPDTC